MPEQKSTEQLQKEREEAAKQLEQILNTSRPKGLVQGTATGCSNMLKGAVGGAGFAVLGPTLGLAVGLQRGGLLGGIVGVTAGAIAGIIGGAAMVVGGALGGAGQVIRGLVAAPGSMVAPSQGKWWNEYEGKWKLTSLEEDKGVIENVPEDDSDILGKVQEEVDASIKGSQTGTVVDMYYYDVLEVPSTVEPSALKRKYYLLARQNHPDKAGPDNKEAAAKFQAISEAYQVLSDPKLREQYDKVGKQGLSADKTSTNSSPQVDSAILFAFLFGSDQFYDYIGRLSTATSASIGDSPKISLSKARTIQERRVIRLALKLATKIDAWVELAKATQNAESSGVVGEQWRAEVLELRMASFGHQLVTTIGKIYSMLAIMYLGSIESGQGLPSLSKWAASQNAALEKSQAANKNKMNTLKAGMTMMKVQADLQQKLQKAETEEEKQAIAKEMEEKASEVLLEILWTTTIVDITSTIHEATQMVFFDQNVDKETRKYRAMAVKVLGQIWMECPEPKSIDPEEKTAKQMYEQAAFAAMLETVKRRDEAAFGAAT